MLVNRKVLVDALTAMKGLLPTRGPTQYAVFNGKTVRYASGDTEMTHQLQIETAAPFSLPLNATLAFLSACDGDIDLTVNGGSVVIKIGNDTCTLVCGDPDRIPITFPTPADPTYPALTPLRIEALEFLKLLDRTVWAAAREQGRYAINGIWLQSFADKTLIACATDGRKLVEATSHLDAASDTFKAGVIASSEWCREARALAERHPASFLYLAAWGSYVSVSDAMGDTVITGHVVEGIFPKYKSVFPKTTAAVKIAKGTFIQALRKAYATSERGEGVWTVKLYFTPGTLQFESSGLHGSCKIRVPIEYTGEPTVLSFDSRYLLAAETVNAPELTLEWVEGNPDRPMVISVPNWRYCIMPKNDRG